MTGIQIWQMLTDIGLIGSVVYLALRFMKSPPTNDAIAKLEDSAQQLIQEAEGATRTLNSELMRRQQNLEQLLGQFENVEKRIKRSITEANQVSSEVVSTPAARQPAVNTSRTVEPPPVINRRSVRSDSVPASQNYEEIREEPKRSVKSKVNIFGELVQEESIEVFESATPIRPVDNKELAKLLEKRIGRKGSQVVGAPVAEKKERSGNMYKLAEELILAGQDIKTIVAQTRMSAADIKMLKEMIDGRKATELPELIEEVEIQAASPTETKRTDPRLGVLANYSV